MVFFIRFSVFVFFSRTPIFDSGSGHDGKQQGDGQEMTREYRRVYMYVSLSLLLLIIVSLFFSVCLSLSLSRKTTENTIICE